MRWRRLRYMLVLRLRSIFCRGTVEDELDEELHFHLQCKAEEEMNRGADTREAHYRALRAIGGLEQRKEEIRDMRRVRWFSDFADDLKYALRWIRHSKLFTTLVVLTLGLGIGANSAIFSLADAILLRPLPVLRPSEIVTLSSFSPSSSSESIGLFSYRDYMDYRDRAKSFEGLAAYSFAMNFGFASRKGELPKLKGGLFVSGNLFQVMGVRPELGRDFNAEEDQIPGRNPVVVLGNEFWRSEFGGDRAVVGRHILLDGMEFSVIGVAPKKFTGLDQYVRPDVFVPIMMWPSLTNSEQDLLNNRAARELIVKGRLKPGVSIPQARAEMRVIAKDLRRAYPKTNLNREATVRSELVMRLHSDPSNAALTGVLLGLAGAVLLIACANVAGLLLGRAGARSREIAVRLAIGAGRFRLVRLLFAESLLIAIIGEAVGIALGYGGVRFFGRFQIPTDLPIRLSVQLDRRAFLFSLFISLLSAILFGLAPALQSARTDVVYALKTADADLSGGRRLWGRNTLVIWQVAASLALLTAALQMVRTFQEKWRGGPGFRTDHLLTMVFDPQLVRYTEAQTHRFYKDLVQRARLVPSVKSAALTGELPMSNDQDDVSVIPEGYQMPPGRESFPVDMDVADESYFHTLGVQLVRGRGFSNTDTASAPKIAVVNEQFAKHYWPNIDALGKRFRLNNADGPLVQIVGISKTAKYEWMGEPPTEFIYLPMAQHPRSKMTLLVESDAPPTALAERIRGIVRNLDSGQPVIGVKTIEEFYQKRVAMAPVMIIQAVSAMGLIGLALALGGLYGLMAYVTSRRTREIGIRMAVGADAKAVLHMVLRQALVLVIGGIGIGVLLAMAAEKGLNAVFETTRTDIGAYLVILPSLLCVTMLAALIPARKAARIEPMRALRYE
ncbi:MAG: ABC transporter permease [Acidobacteriaceae bacterium]|nr:ABC transporter permease [Acidobacteriaceae bacterium]MBV9780485.1 ABC transporter permease [Acidobacteriaceae bacterium]